MTQHEIGQKIITTIKRIESIYIDIEFLQEYCEIDEYALKEIYRLQELKCQYFDYVNALFSLYECFEKERQFKDKIAKIKERSSK